MDLNAADSLGNVLNSERRRGPVSQNSVASSDFWHRLDPSLKKMDLNGQLHHLLNLEINEDNFNNLLQLLSKGADPNITDSDGNSLIHLAIMRCPVSSDKFVLELMRVGANINVVNKYGSTPLTFSLYFRCQKTTIILIKRGINLHFQCQQGWSALMIASMLGDFVSVRTMLQHGANVNLFDTNGRTALMFAVEGRYLNVVQELLKYGANPNMHNCLNKTALHIVLERPCPKLDVLYELLLHCASYFNLGPTREASFFKIMKMCTLEEQQPYHNCVKIIIKIQMLFTLDHHSVDRFEGLSDFAEVCCPEVRYMGMFNVSVINSVKRLLTKCVEGCMPRECELEALLPFIANERFTIYSDILKALVTQSYLRKKFLKMLMYAKVTRGNQENQVILNSDINLRIMSYLSDMEVSRFVLAFYLEINSQENISSRDRFLYPTGQNCNWNELIVS